MMLLLVRARDVKPNFNHTTILPWLHATEDISLSLFYIGIGYLLGQNTVERG